MVCYLSIKEVKMAAFDPVCPFCGSILVKRIDDLRKIYKCQSAECSQTFPESQLRYNVGASPISHKIP
jgi:ribosomal protein L37AE/L43A